jgi:peptidyl-prolyl cis-trans isomerase A (cyclophilin A)
MKALGTIIIVILAVGALVMFARSPEVSAPSEELTTSTELTETNEQEIVLGEETETVFSQESEETIMTTATVTTNKGVFELELFGDLAPKTVNNFVTLAEDGYYDGVKFHRVIKGFMIQGGDPNTKNDDAMDTWGTGGPGYTFDDEFGEGLSNIKGTISMANSGPNTNGSQFFINTADNTFLDHDKEPLTSKHAVFGRVTSGMEVITEIENSETGFRDIPVEPIIIESIEIKR